MSQTAPTFEKPTIEDNPIFFQIDCLLVIPFMSKNVCYWNVCTMQTQRTIDISVIFGMMFSVIFAYWYGCGGIMWKSHEYRQTLPCITYVSVEIFTFQIGSDVCMFCVCPSSSTSS